MAAMHGRRSLRQKEQNYAAHMRALLQGMLAKPLDIDLPYESLDLAEVMMRANQERLQQAIQAGHAKP